MASDLPDVPGYVLTHLLGHGSFGEVFAAHSVAAPERQLAIKVFKRDVIVRTKDVLRVQREGRIGFELRHANIVEVHEIGEIDGRHFIVMERVEGEQLRDRILRRFPQGEVRAVEDPGALARELRIVASVCRAAGHAHRCNIIHRDIKPANILVRSDGHPFLIDFGLGRHLDGESTLTSTGVTVGSYYYMAPEQLDADAERVGAASDIYALGATLHHVCTGRVPFTATNANELRRRVLEEEVAPAPPGLPAGLERIWLRALEKQPQHRYRSAEEMADDLERVADGLRPRHEGAPLFALRGWRSVSRRRWNIVAATTLALLLAVALLWLRVKDSDSLRLANLLAIGQAALLRGEVDAAGAHFAEAARVAPDDPTPELNLAASFHIAARPAAAKEAVERARARGFVPCDEQSTSATAHSLTALFHLANDDESRAIDCLRRTVALDAATHDRSRPEAHLLLAHLLQRNGARDEALAQLSEYLQCVPPNSPAALSARVLSLELQGRHAEALGELDSHAHPDADTAGIDVAGYRGRLLLRLTRYEEAREVLIEATRTHPEEGANWVNLGICCYRMHRLAEAREACEAGLTRRPRLVSAHTLLAKLAIDRSDWDEAAKHLTGFEGGLSESDVASMRDGQRLFLAGEEADANGEYEHAEKSLRACLDSVPDHVGALLLLGSDLCADDRNAEALPFLLRALATFQNRGRSVATCRDLLNSLYLNDENQFALQVATFGAATQVGDETHAAETQLEIERQLSARGSLPAVLLYNYAEAICLSTLPGFRDLCRARDALDSPKRVGDLPDGPKNRDVIEKIRAGCPR